VERKPERRHPRGTISGSTITIRDSFCGRRAIVNAWIGHREHPDQFIVNGKIGFVNARIGDREQLDRSS
jgi:hypothetical protein